MTFKIGFEFIDFDIEGIKLLFNLNGLVTNNVDNIFFNFINFLLSFIKSTFCSFDGL